MENMHPLWVVPGVRRGRSMVFLGPDQEIVIGSFIEHIERLLYLCNGRISREAIIRRLPREDRDTYSLILDDLIDLGIVIDSREAYQQFHRQTLNPQTFSRDMTAVDIAQHYASPRVALPAGEPVDLPVTDRSELRSPTCRQFSTAGLSKATITEFLRSSVGGIHGPTPSAGGLYPQQTYLVVRRSPDLAPGYYAYDGPSDCLVRLVHDQFDDELVAYALDSETVLGNAPVVLVLAADLKRQPDKYSNRGYRFSLIEAGHCAQNIHLYASRHGYGVFEYGGFSDEKLRTALAMPGPVWPLIVLGVGFPSMEVRPTAQLILDELSPYYLGRNKPVNRISEVLVDGSSGGEFYTASSHYRSVKGQPARETYDQRYASGVGRSRAEARLKALVEGVERHKSGCIRVDVTCSSDELGLRFVDPRTVVPLGLDQRQKMGFEQFSPTSAYGWRIGRDMVTGDPVAAPIDLVYYPVYEREVGRKLCYSANSSGVAAHTSRAEAERRALLELLERDAVMRTWLYRDAPDRVSLMVLPMHVQRRASWWQSNGYELTVFDLSRNGVAIASVFIHGNAYPAQSNGASASLASFEEAVLKALSEAEHGLLVELRDGATRESELVPEKVLSPIDHARYYYNPSNAQAISWIYEGKVIDHVPSVMATYAGIVERLRPVAIDLSSPVEAIQVSRVLCERLVPINFGFATEHDLHSSLDQDRVTRAMLHPHFFA